MYLRLVAFVQFLPISHFSVLLSSKFLHSFHFSHVLFLLSDQSLANLLTTLTFSSRLFPQISNLLPPSSSPSFLPPTSLSSHFLPSIAILSLSCPNTLHPSEHVPPQIFHHRCLSQSHISPSYNPFLPILVHPQRGAFSPPAPAFLSHTIHLGGRHRRLSRSFSLVSSPSYAAEPIVDLCLVGGRAVCRRHRAARSQSGCLPRALLTATPRARGTLPDASRVTTVSSTIVARPRDSGRLPPARNCLHELTWCRCVPLDLIFYRFYSVGTYSARNVKPSSDSLRNSYNT